MSDLEKDFDTVVTEINAKLKEAAKALQEANKLREDLGLPGLIYTQWTRENEERKNSRKEDPLDEDTLDEELYALEEKMEKIDVHDLERALGQCGWSTSSSYC